MDVKQHLEQLPEPEPEAIERVWRHYQRDRHATSPPWRRAAPWALGLTSAAAAALALVSLRAEPEVARTVALEASERAPMTTTWSPEIQLTLAGEGEAHGTSADAEIRWRSGTITARVEPDAGNRLAIVTEEARVEVVGTVFSVTRDALGVRTSVEHGRVRVRCQAGFDGEIGPDDAPVLCLPVRPEALLGRADALEEQGADVATRVATLDAGLAAAAPGSGVAGELRWRRMLARQQLGDLDGALRDADQYLKDGGPRVLDVRRLAGWAALAGRDGCARALPYLSALELQGTAQDRVLLAECLADDQPERARAWIDDALPKLDPTWRERALHVLRRLPQR